MDYRSEVQTKLARARELMERHNIGALWLRRAASIAWITGGVDVAVNTADIFGVASVVITANDAEMWTTTIEAPRLATEDRVEERGFMLRITPWEQPQGVDLGSTLGTDFPLDGATDLTRAISILRASLLPVEQARFRQLSGTCAEAMQRAINRVKPGITEAEIAAGLGYETRARGATPIVVLVAVDDRVHKVRHPLPSDTIMERYAMLALCGRRAGLVCSITRLVHFGALPDDLRRRMHATAEVDAALIAASTPGTTLEEVFEVTRQAYARVGFPEEWKLHHQGGLTGYTPRELLAVPGEQTALQAGMIAAWNPSITGAKSEDSVLVTDGAPEVLTAIYGWPAQTVTVGATTIDRPLILEIT